MDKTNNKSKEESNLQDKDKRNLFLGGVIVLFIAITPLLFYSYKNFPNEEIWKTSYFEFSTAYGSWFNYAWYLTSKLIPIYLLLIWFFTCKHWWHWIILVPLAMYSFQLWGIINESNSIDEVELIYLFPLMMIIIPGVYVIRAKLFAKIHADDFQSFEEELGQKRTTWQQIKDLFS